MESKNIIETVQGRVKIIKFDKPERKNAFDAEMYLKVASILNDAATDENIAVAVVTGTGNYYSSGNDVVASREPSTYNLPAAVNSFIEAFIRFPKLLVAIVNGPAIGLAATTLGLCDMVYASDKAFIYTPFSKLGISAEGCSTVTFPRIMGTKKATEMLMLNHKMSADEAYRCGFINDVYKPEELQSKVWEKITEMSNLPQHSITTTKRLMRNVDELITVNNNETEELHKIWGGKSANSFHFNKLSKI